MKIYIAADHAGFLMKEKLIDFLKKQNDVIDVGPKNEDRTDYPDYADKLVLELKQNPTAIGILLCGSGQGMAMRANKYAFVRAALCWNEESARLARAHNDANVLCLGARLLPEKEIHNIVQAFFATKFEGGRHADRVQKINTSPK